MFCTDYCPSDRGDISRAIFALGLQDTDHDGLGPPPGIEILGASSDHLVVDSRHVRLSVGAEVRFQLNYSALVRAMTSPFVGKMLTTLGHAGPRAGCPASETQTTYGRRDARHAVPQLQP